MYVCKDKEHPAFVALGWGAGYPAVRPPVCHGVPMELAEGEPDPADTLEPIEAEDQPADPAELQHEQ